MHRTGCGGRFGRKGVTINFVTAEDVRMIGDITSTPWDVDRGSKVTKFADDLGDVMSISMN